MSDKNLTDAEIKKALECCTANGLDVCAGCPCYADNDLTSAQCMCGLMSDALDLINRQKAEVEKQKKKVEARNKVIGMQKTEVERLGAEVENKQFRCDSCDRIALTSSEHRFCVKQAKAEAYKECIGKAKEKAYTYSDITGYQSTVVDVNELDNLLKELVGETQ